MAELAAHIGRETEIQALGRTWQLARLDRGIWRKWIDWAKTQLPDPVEEALKVVDRLKPEVASAIVQKALEEKTSFLSLGSPKVNALMRAPEGIVQLFFLLLQKNHKDATEDDAMAIVLEIGEEAAQTSFDKASGTLPAPGNR
jgi:hypothetical protein